MTRSQRNYLFTLNNYTDAEVQDLRKCFESDAVKYAVFGYEVCPTTGTPHLQGFVSFNQRRTLNWCKNTVSNRAHFESAQASPQKNREYCLKTRPEDQTPNERFEEFGDIPQGQGNRTDLAAVIQKAQAGATLKEIAEACPASYLRYYRGITKLRNMYREPRTWAPEVFVYWGKTGTGKTRKAWTDGGPESFVYAGVPGQPAWFDPYDGEETVIFDDFSGGLFPITYLLRLLDRYPMWVPIKGDHVQWIPKKIFITSNYRVEDWYPTAKEEHQLALKRRINTTVHFGV